VKRACAWGLNSGMDPKKIDTTIEKKIDMADFENALKEVKPIFGSDSVQLENCLQYQMIDYGNTYLNINGKLMNLLEQVRSSKSSNMLSILLEGEMGTGKTALACNLALKSLFPYVKFISPETLVNFLENGKVHAISKIFEDAYKSPFSIVILDNLERIIEYIKIGPRFSNIILQTLLVYIRKFPPNQDKKLVVIGTTSIADRLDDLELVKSFNVKINVPLLSNNDDIMGVLNSFDIKKQEKEKICNALVGGIPIKKLLMILDSARQISGGNITIDHFMTA